MTLRTRILLVFIFATSLSVGSLLFWLNDEMRPRYLEAQEDILVDMSRVLAVLIRERGLVFSEQRPTLQPAYLRELLDEAFTEAVDARIYSLHKQRVDLRVYVTDAQGIVRYDSDQGRDLGRDYSAWRDVHLTLRGRYGARSTTGDPIYPEGSTMYVTAPIRWQGEPIGTVAVGKPTRNAERFREVAIDRFTQAGLVAILVAVAFGLMVYWWIGRPLRRLYRYARAVEAGERISLPRLGDNEIGQVGQAMESMRSALDGKSYVADYVQSLTHELKSPTAGIRGAAELLTEAMPAGQRQRFIRHILTETERIQDLVDRLLALAKIEGHQGLEQPEPVPLGPLAEAVCATLFPLANEAGVRLQVAVSRPCPPILGDAFLLRQAVDNLIKNAIEFSPAGGQVQIQLHCSGPEVLLTVSDQGPGVPDYATTRVFERFYSLARPNGRKGTGLGLSFVREIAALHHGQIALGNRTDGPGAIATLTLPPLLGKGMMPPYRHPAGLGR